MRGYIVAVLSLLISGGALALDRGAGQEEAMRESPSEAARESDRLNGRAPAPLSCNKVHCATPTYMWAIKPPENECETCS